MNIIVIIPSRTNKINPKLRQKTGRISGVGGKLKVGVEWARPKKLVRKQYLSTKHYRIIVCFSCNSVKVMVTLKSFYGTIMKYSPHISAQWSMKSYFGMLLWLESREVFLHFLIEKFTFWFNNKKSHPNRINCCMIINCSNLVVQTVSLFYCFIFFQGMRNFCMHSCILSSVLLPSRHFFFNLSNLNFDVINFLN